MSCTVKITVASTCCASEAGCDSADDPAKNRHRILLRTSQLHNKLKYNFLGIQKYTNTKAAIRWNSKKIYVDVMLTSVRRLITETF